MVPSDADIVAGIADALPFGVWVARAPGGEFVYANPRFAEIMGMSARADVAVGEYAAPYSIHDRDGNLYPEDRMPFVRALEARETVTVDDIVIHTPTGGRASIRAYARPIFDGDTITHVVIAFLDITREVEAEARLRRAQRMESVGSLAGGIAHDFNNLLAVIRAISSTLLVAEQDPRRREELAAIDSATESAVQLTRSLLAFAGRETVTTEPVSVTELVERLSELLSRALDRRVVLRQDLTSRRRVEGDASQLEQVVMNLVLNARDALAGPGVITLRTRDERGQVVLEVDDTGPGVPVAIRDRVFEPYFTTKRGDGPRGAGLGLATVYGIVEAHGGSIMVTDAPGGGARFQVRLPALGRGARPTPAIPQAAIVPGQGLILVVDDEPAVRTWTRRALEELGFSVIEAADGEEALRVYAEHSGDVRAIVLDMTMPGLDGRATFLALREIDPNVRVLLTSGYALNEEARAILDLGVDGFLAKPFGVRQLSAAMAELF
ncbi:MAG: response regulator [Sandaracinaceae bacterium]|nr:response regulator [Sandaracinaceae bacterium]